MIGQRRLIGQLCLIELVAWGVLYYAFSVFLPLMQADLGWSSTVLSLGFSVALIVSGVAAPFVGAWIDRQGSRGVMLMGASLGSLGVAIWSVATSLPVYLTAWILIGAGMAGTLYSPAFATVVRANPDTSRDAILIITLVGALASTLFLPLAAALAHALGWRSGLLALAGVLALVTVPLTMALPRRSSTQPETTRRKASDPRVAPAGFRQIVVALMVASTAGVAFNTHLIVFLIARLDSHQVAAGIAGLAGLAKIGGRLSTAVARRHSAMTLMRASLFVTALALVLPLIWPSTAAALAMVLLVGATTGARTILRPALIVEVFGVHSFGQKDGTLQLFTTFAKAAGPVGLGLLLSLVGERWAWASLALLMTISGVMMLRVHADHAVGKRSARPTQDSTIEEGVTS